jgi:hypothetical protein
MKRITIIFLAIVGLATIAAREPRKPIAADTTYIELSNIAKVITDTVQTNTKPRVDYYVTTTDSRLLKANKTVAHRIELCRKNNLKQRFTVIRGKRITL